MKKRPKNKVKLQIKNIQQNRNKTVTNKRRIRQSKNYSIENMA